MRPPVSNRGVCQGQAVKLHVKYTYNLQLQTSHTVANDCTVTSDRNMMSPSRLPCNPGPIPRCFRLPHHLQCARHRHPLRHRRLERLLKKILSVEGNSGRHSRDRKKRNDHS